MVSCSAGGLGCTAEVRRARSPVGTGSGGQHENKGSVVAHWRYVSSIQPETAQHKRDLAEADTDDRLKASLVHEILRQHKVGECLRTNFAILVRHQSYSLDHIRRSVVPMLRRNARRGGR